MKSNQRYIMVTYEFGTPVYIAPPSLANINITDDKAKAATWVKEDVLSSCKLPYHKALTGYKELQFEPIS